MSDKIMNSINFAEISPIELCRRSGMKDVVQAEEMLDRYSQYSAGLEDASGLAGSADNWRRFVDMEKYGIPLDEVVPARARNVTGDDSVVSIFDCH